MKNKYVLAPESTAVRVALWRALHVEVDSAPHVLEDTIGLQLIAPEDGWRNRPDMNPDFTKLFRASIVARARFIEDLVTLHSQKGIDQYIILGAGLDTFAERRPEIASHLKIFEVDQPGPQQWKQQRLKELCFNIPSGLHFVPVDFEAGESWIDQLEVAGFDKKKPALIASTGVSMYLTKEANFSTLSQIAKLAPGSILAMTFLLPIEIVDSKERSGHEASQKGAKASGTPFISFFTPDEMMALAKDAGFSETSYVAGSELNLRYFSGRTDGLATGDSEGMLVARI